MPGAVLLTIWLTWSDLVQECSLFISSHLISFPSLKVFPKKMLDVCLLSAPEVGQGLQGIIGEQELHHGITIKADCVILD